MRVSDGLNENSILTFGYGSNLCLSRLESRLGGAGTAAFVEVGHLAGYQFRYHKKSKDRDGDPIPSGKGNALHTGSPQDRVWGVVFAVQRVRLGALDDAEGLGHGYERNALSVQVGDGTLQAFVYVATDIDDSLVPYDWYRRLVIDGLKSWSGIPNDYIESVAALSAGRADPVGTRARREWAWHCTPRGTL